MKKIVISVLGVLALCVVAGAVWIFSVLSNLPDVSLLKHYRPSAAAEVQDKDGNELTRYFGRTCRIWVPVSTLPDVVIEAVVTAEDDTFFEHHGVNYKAAWDALVHDVHKGRFARGGSTITQQMIKNVLLSKEKTISRKVREYVLARRAEEILTKRRILEIYLNVVEWGENIYGIEAASRAYFGKPSSGLNAAEAAFLAGMLPNPHYYNPYKHLDKARERQERVLFNMQQARLLSQDEYARALQYTLIFRQPAPESASRDLLENGDRPCYQYALEQTLVDAFGERGLYRSGKVIRTTLDGRLQEELSKEEHSPECTEGEGKEPLVAVTEGNKVRAFVCSSDREKVLRDLGRSGSALPPAYEVSVVSPRSIKPEQIVLSVSEDR
jgi:monofunctional glycosyltransferase